jgi:glycerophosphoryl diester phosphodiesterase
MGIQIIKGDDKIDASEVKRNLNYFAWICSLFFIAIGLLISWRLIEIQEYFLAFIFSLIFFVAFFPVKNLIFNLSIKYVKKKNPLLMDLVIIKINRKRFFAFSGLTIFSSSLLFIIFVAALVPNINIIKADKVILGAHRGSSEDFIENTIPAFEDAVENEKYKFIEFDIQYTKDKKLIVHHGPLMGIKFNEWSYYVEDLTYEELLNTSYYHIPLYAEVMEVVASKKPLNIEIKSQGNFTDDKEIVDFVIADSKERGILESTLFSSVSPDVVKYFSEKCPECETGKIYYTKPSTFFNFDVFISEIYDEVEDINADYVIIHGSNLRHYKSLKKSLPENKTLVIWYLFLDDQKNDEMFIIDPKDDDWIFRLGGKVIYSKERCFWWC